MRIDTIRPNVRCFWGAVVGGALSAAGSIGASRAPKSATTSTEAIMTPEQKAMLALTTKLAQLRIAGVQTPEERRAIAAATNQADVGVANGMRDIETLAARGGYGGSTDSAFRKINEAAIANRIDAGNQIASAAYDNAYNTAVQIGLRGPQKGQQTTVPQSNAGAVGQGAFGAVSSLMQAFPAKGAATPATPAAVDPAANEELVRKLMATGRFGFMR